MREKVSAAPGVQVEFLGQAGPVLRCSEDSEFYRAEQSLGSPEHHAQSQDRLGVETLVHDRCSRVHLLHGYFQQRRTHAVTSIGGVR